MIRPKYNANQRQEMRLKTMHGEFMKAELTKLILFRELNKSVSNCLNKIS